MVFVVKQKLIQLMIVEYAVLNDAWSAHIRLMGGGSISSGRYFCLSYLTLFVLHVITELFSF